MAKQQPLSDDDRADLVAYLDGELDEEASRALESKLSLDPKARAEADSLKAGQLAELTVTLLLPVALTVTVSFTLNVWLPAVLKVMPKPLEPLDNPEFAGNTAATQSTFINFAKLALHQTVVVTELLLLDQTERVIGMLAA